MSPADTPNTRHTPGPWRLSGKGTVRGDGHRVASVAWIDQYGNARLIAAAPDLLLACQTLIRGDNLQAAIDLARVAIVKAEGK